DVAGGRHGAAGGRYDVPLEDASHAGDADGGEQAADGGWNQAHQQRNQRRDRDRVAPSRRLGGVDREGEQCRAGDQENQAHDHEQHGEGNLVRRLPALRPFDQGYHTVVKGLAGSVGDSHDDPIGEHARAAGDGTQVAASLADYRRRFARDGAFVHRRDALYDLAVAGNEVARFHQNEVSAPEGRGRRRHHLAVTLPLGEELRLDLASRLPQRLRLRLAAALGDRYGEIREEHREPERDRYREDEEGRCLALSYDRLNEQKGGEPAPDVHDEHHRVLQLVRRAQLAHRIDQRPAQDSAAHQRLS